MSMTDGFVTIHHFLKLLCRRHAIWWVKLILTYIDDIVDIRAMQAWCLVYFVLLFFLDVAVQSIMLYTINIAKFIYSKVDTALVCRRQFL